MNELNTQEKQAIMATAYRLAYRKPPKVAAIKVFGYAVWGGMAGFAVFGLVGNSDLAVLSGLVCCIGLVGNRFLFGGKLAKQRFDRLKCRLTTRYQSERPADLAAWCQQMLANGRQRPQAQQNGE